MRRANPSGTPRAFVWIVPGVGALVAGGWFLHVLSDPFRNLERLDLASYAESAKSFQGGTYLLEGAVEEQLGYREGRGKLIGLRCSETRGPVFIPVLVPDSLSSFPLQKGQRLQVKARGDVRGLFVAEVIRKK